MKLWTYITPLPNLIKPGHFGLPLSHHTSELEEGKTNKQKKHPRVKLLGWERERKRKWKPLLLLFFFPWSAHNKPCHANPTSYWNWGIANCECCCWQETRIRGGVIKKQLPCLPSSCSVCQDGFTQEGLLTANLSLSFSLSLRVYINITIYMCVYI